MYKFLNIILISFLIISCVGREKHPKGVYVSSTAPFIVEEIAKSGNAVTPINIIEKAALADRFIISLSTCLKDSIRQDVPIQNVEFIIEYQNDINSESKKTISVVTDSKGCITWDEEYPYRYTIKPVWLVLNRNIKVERGPFAGQETIPLAVNPWLTADDKFPAILDLRPIYSKNHNILKKYPPQQKGLEYLFSKSNYASYPQLWAHKLDVQIKPKILKQTRNVKDLLDGKYQEDCVNESENSSCHYRNFTMNLTVPLDLRTYSLGGDLIDNSLNGGSYKVKFQLLAIPNIHESVYRIHKNICEKEIKINDISESQSTKFISVECDISIAHFNPNAQHKLAVEIVPDKPLPFKKFQGLYTIDLSNAAYIGSVRSYNIDSHLDKEYGSFDKEISILESLNIEFYSGNVKKSDHGFQPVTLSVTLDNIKFSDVVNNETCQTNESAVKRQIRYISKACLVDTITDRKYNKTKFRIFIEDENNLERKEFCVKRSSSNEKGIAYPSKSCSPEEIPETDQHGCISWSDIVDHNIYDRQRYKKIKAKFINEEYDVYGDTTYAVNPWQRAFQFSHDIDRLGDDGTRTSVTGVDKPKLIINQFKSVNLFPSYVLDKFLNLHVFQNIYFLFQPFITRHDNVSLGKDHKSRGIIRDGYYIVRVLVARNPQENEVIQRVSTVKQHKTLREEVSNEKQSPQFKDLKYLTHVDTVIKAEANFLNLYMPLSFTKDQMLYLGSRNIISIEVIPADPSKFVFKPIQKEGDTCEIDLEKTEWAPYFDHDLINQPYAGAFNAQAWTNWNVLRSDKHLDTDRIIERDSIGKKYMYFNLNENCKNGGCTARLYKNPKYIVGKSNNCKGMTKNDNEEVSISVSDAEKCSPQDANDLNEDALIADTKSITAQNYTKSIEELKQSNPHKFDDQNMNEILSNFAKSNSLKVVSLDKKQGNNFIKDIISSSEKIKNKVQGYYYKKLSDKQLDLIADADLRQMIEQDILDECGKAPRFIRNRQREICVDEVFKNHLKDFIPEISTEKDYKEMMDYIQDSRYQGIEITRKNILNFLNILPPASLIKTNTEDLKDIITTGISEESRQDIKSLNFAKSMCGFWFFSFFDKYLDKDQLKQAYTNFVSQYDYYAVLENDSMSGYNKYASLNSLFNIFEQKDVSLKTCHEEYLQCVVSDHCQYRDHTKKKQNTYCKGHSASEDKSCINILNKTCKSNSNHPLCKKDITNETCHYSLDEFCKINYDYKVCKKYHSRCLRNYNSCIGSDANNQTFSDYKPFDFLDKLKPEDHLSYVNSKGQKVGHSERAFEQLRQGGLAGHFVQFPYLDHFKMLKACMKSPFDFFEFHNKMFIDEISDESPKYIGGLSTTFNASSNISTGSYMNWTAQHGSSVSVKSGASLSPKIYGVGLTFADFSISQSASTNVSNSGRRAIDVRVGEGAFLFTSKATIDVTVTKSKKCLVVKPRPYAFFGEFKKGLIKPYKYSKYLWSPGFSDYKKILASRLGLIVCNPESEKPEIIRENYYYISQFENTNTAQLLNLYDLSNRPFAAFIRGKKEFYNFFNMARGIIEGDDGDLGANAQIHETPTNMFYNYSHPIEEIVSLNYTIRELSLSGFYPGVYDYNQDSDYLDAPFKNRDPNLFQRAFKGFTWNVFPTPVSPSSNNGGIAITNN